MLNLFAYRNLHIEKRAKILNGQKEQYQQSRKV